MRKVASLVALATAGALLGIAPAAAQTTPEVTAFCEAALTTDKAADKVFSSERPKQKDIQAFQASLTQIESTAPPEVAANVQAAAASVRTAIQNRQDPFDDPSFEQNINAIDQYRFNSCGYTQIQTTGNEYSFEGQPSTVQAGTVAIQFSNTGAELHELAIYRIKGKDSVKKIVGLSEKEQRKKLEEIGGTFAMQGQTSYTIAELAKPGRYALVCHLPVGSTSVEAAEEAEKDHPKSHAEEGMYATLTVERGSTTTSSG
jgi:plastocyanin